MLCPRCGKWVRTLKVCGSCLQAERTQLRADFETDWIRAKLVQRVIRDSWSAEEEQERRAGCVSDDGRPSYQGHSLPEDVRQRILALVAETDSAGRPCWTYADIARRLDCHHITVRSVCRAAGLVSRRSFMAAG